MTQFPLPPELLPDLQLVEQRLAERTRSRAAVISVAGSHLLAEGAVRARAALVLMAAQTGTYQRERVFHAASAVELIYAATQTHDDLIDEAERRRGTSRSGEWGHGVALMVGDYLFALASGEMALSPDPRVIDFFSQAVMRITEETIGRPVTLGSLGEARERHLGRLAGMAAALYVAACKAGGACGGVPAEQIETLGRYGHALGMALAIGDEARDFGDPEGRELRGASLRAGLVTLPLIYAAAYGDGQGLAAALDSGDPAAQSWAAAEVRRHGLAPARAELARLAAEAHAALAALPASPGRDSLERVASYAAARAG